MPRPIAVKYQVCSARTGRDVHERLQGNGPFRASGIHFSSKEHAALSSEITVSTMIGLSLRKHVANEHSRHIRTDGKLKTETLLSRMRQRTGQMCNAWMFFSIHLCTHILVVPPHLLFCYFSFSLFILAFLSQLPWSFYIVLRDLILFVFSSFCQLAPHIFLGEAERSSRTPGHPMIGQAPEQTAWPWASAPSRVMPSWCRWRAARVLETTCNCTLWVIQLITV